jgi:hypothetical protein
MPLFLFFLEQKKQINKQVIPMEDNKTSGENQSRINMSR